MSGSFFSAPAASGIAPQVVSPGTWASSSPAPAQSSCTAASTAAAAPAPAPGTAPDTSEVAARVAAELRLRRDLAPPLLRRFLVDGLLGLVPHASPPADGDAVVSGCHEEAVGVACGAGGTRATDAAASTRPMLLLGLPDSSRPFCTTGHPTSTPALSGTCCVIGPRTHENVG